LHNRTNPWFAVLEHLGVAVIVIILSRVLGNFISRL